MSVFITGSSGYIGTQLCKRFEEWEMMDEIVALDLLPPRETFAKLSFYQQDCNSDLSSIFENHDICTIIHLVFVLNPLHNSKKMYRINVGSLENVLKYVENYDVKRIIVTSSAAAYGAHADNSMWITEDQPLHGNRDYQYARDKTIVEAKLKEFGEKHSEIEIIIARPAIVCGPHIGNFISRYMSKAFVPLVKDCKTEMQFIHEDDVTEALYVLTTEASPGIYNLGPPNTIHPSNAVKMIGGKVIRVRSRLLRFLMAVGWTLRLSSLTEAPKSMIDFIEYPWVVDGSKIERLTPFRYKYSSADAIRDFAQAQKKGN